MKTETQTATPDLLDAEPSAAQLPAHAPQNAPVVQGAVTPADLLRHALDSGADLDRLEKLMDLQQRHEANEARKAFADDMARFKLKPLSIAKDKHVQFETSKGWTDYHHATIGNVCDVIIGALAEFGFSHRWVPSQQDGQCIVDCVITHRLGHEQHTVLKAAPDQTGGKNSIQAIISANTYLSRHSLLMAVGMATKDQEDDDGRGAGAASIPDDKSLAEVWIGKVAAAPTDAEVVKVWDAGIVVIERAKDRDAYAKFKAAVAARRAEIAKQAGLA